MEKSKRHLGHVTVVVRDYDEAIDYYTKKLGFRLIEDTDLGDDKRWVLVAPQDSECTLLLGKASTHEQQSAIGHQTGGRVFLFLHTSDFWSDYGAMQERGVVFKEHPREEDYGTVVVFEDLYGNLWDLLQLR